MATRKKMIEWFYFHGINPIKFIFPIIYCVHIDDALDFEVAKA